MVQLTSPTKALVFGSFLFRNDIYQYSDIKRLWESRNGDSIYFHHNYFPMKDYYSKEMGDSDLLSRFFGVSLELRDREDLVKEKIWSTEIEYEKTGNNSGQARSLNLDVGLITLENVGLATSKNFSHRVYLGEGVFYDLTYTYSSNTYNCLNWTYPDYSNSEIIAFFSHARSVLQSKLIDKSS
jgi:hypothetical protein